MIKPSNRTCNKQVQKFTNTSYDMLLELYNNTGFFKDLWESLNPGYLIDFGLGLGNWEAVTGTLEQAEGYALNFGGHIQNQQLNFSADQNKVLTFIFENLGNNAFADVTISYFDGRVITYPNAFQYVTGTNNAILDLSNEEQHSGIVTGLLINFNSLSNQQFNLFKLVVGKPLLAISNLSALEARLTSVEQRTDSIESVTNALNHIINNLQETPVLRVTALSQEPEQERYDVRGVVIDGTEKKILFRDDSIEIQNQSGSTYLKYDVNQDNLEFKGIIVLPDGHVISSIEDIRAQDGQSGNQTEMRFRASTAKPTVENANPNPPNWFLAPPESELPIWFIVATKDSEGSLVTTWSVPARLTGAGSDTIVAYLTSENYIAISDSDGTNPNLSAAGGEFVLTKNGVKVTSGVNYSGGVTKNGLQLIINPTSGLFNLTGSNWSTDVEFFDLTATYEGKTYTKRYSVVKQRRAAGGGGGENGSSTITLLLYRSSVRSATSVPTPSGPVTFNLANLTLTEDSANALNGWSLLIPEDTLPKRWVTQALISTTSNTVQIQPSQWSPPRVLSIDGVDGEDAGGGGGTGLDGFSRATVYAYKAANSIPSNDTPGDVVYTFSTGVATLGNGWQSSIPESSLPVWVRTGLAISRESTDTINSNEWSDAVKITGSSLNSAQVFIYKRTQTETPPATNDKPTTSVSYSFETGITSGVNNDWTAIPPLGGGKYLWIRAAMAASTGLTDNIEPSEWSEPRLLASDGSDGSSGSGESYPGAERKGATYPNFNWNATGTDSATTRWGVLAGRSPVAGDVFIQVNSSTGETQVRAYNGSAWVEPAQVYESLVTFGVLSGEQILAGSVINAPVIRGGSLELVGNAASEFIKISRNDPFGPNNLIEWFGPKVNGVTWNNSTNSPLFSGMTKANAKTYTGSDGSVYFGGTFSAGTLSNALTNTTIVHDPEQEITFTSNGGLIQIAASVSHSSIENLGIGAACPNPLPSTTATLYLEQQVGGNWVIRGQQTFTGTGFCFEDTDPSGPGTTVSRSVGGSFTYTDNSQTTGVKIYRVRAQISPHFADSSTTQALSITTTE